MREKDFIYQLSQVLEASKPGFAAQKKMAPKPRPGTVPIETVKDHCRQAGVLLLLYSYHQKAHIVLTQRSNHVVHHKDQISLPGGHVENQENPKQAALRETQEELGVALNGIRILGSLTPLYIPRSDYCVCPYVAWIDERPAFHPSPIEVSEILEIPVAYLSDAQNLHQEEWIVRGIPMQVPFFKFHHHQIWGATAMILSEFLYCLRRIDMK